MSYILDPGGKNVRTNFYEDDKEIQKDTGHYNLMCSLLGI